MIYVHTVHTCTYVYMWYVYMCTSCTYIHTYAHVSTTHYVMFLEHTHIRWKTDRSCASSQCSEWRVGHPVSIGLINWVITFTTSKNMLGLATNWIKNIVNIINQVWPWKTINITHLKIWFVYWEVDAWGGAILWSTAVWPCQELTVLTLLTHSMYVQGGL